jgi:D-glycero-D-manno-heptose 1,7-bisphosphate phosphatase
MSKRAVFLDRDGTINEEVGYLSDPDGLVILPGAAEAIRKVNGLSMPVVVISNQSGIARGYFDEAALAAIHERLKNELDKQGAYLNGIYYCPHHPEGTVPEYTQECRCRKPGTALVEKAAMELGIDLEASFMVGDHIKDIQLARAAGMTAVMIMTGHGQEEWDNADDRNRSMADYVAADLASAVAWILQKIGKQ